MKKEIFYLIMLTVVAGCVTSCKDDPAPVGPEVSVLSKVYVDGVLDYEYRYSDEGRLIQTRNYNVSTGNFAGYSDLKYDSRGFLEEAENHNADEEITSVTLYETNPDGQFTSAERYDLDGADLGTLTIRYTFGYNKDGRINRQSWHDPDTDDEYYRIEFFYYENGNRERVEHYESDGISLEKIYEAHHSPGDFVLPESLTTRGGYPVSYEFDLMVAEQIEHFGVSLAPLQEYHEIVSDRMVNEEGLVTELKVTTKFIEPAEPDHVVIMKYEYEKIGL